MHGFAEAGRRQDGCQLAVKCLVQPPTPEWGMMLGEAKNYILSHPYMTTFPGLIIFIAIVGLNLVGDGLRDALDPRLEKAMSP